MVCYEYVIVILFVRKLMINDNISNEYQLKHYLQK